MSNDTRIDSTLATLEANPSAFRDIAEHVATKGANVDLAAVVEGVASYVYRNGAMGLDYICQLARAHVQKVKVAAERERNGLISSHNASHLHISDITSERNARYALATFHIPVLYSLVTRARQEELAVVRPGNHVHGALVFGRKLVFQLSRFCIENVNALVRRGRSKHRTARGVANTLNKVAVAFKGMGELERRTGVDFYQKVFRTICQTARVFWSHGNRKHRLGISCEFALCGAAFPHKNASGSSLCVSAHSDTLGRSIKRNVENGAAKHRHLLPRL
mmetsp:Transcript_10513/g.19372  ORF Transcript_10513/g.19372 Transcript_10513/m.19372 type:complete len:278 (-) Transcript_10513:559-1392(-)